MPNCDLVHRRAAHCAALAVILAAGMLSAAWAFIVPIFQATDEAAHFDYAISILSSGNIVSTRGERTVWIASPYTRYLLGATDYFRIAFHSSMRAPRGYGTLAYYRRLDAAAPSLKDPAAPDGVSYIATAPFGFYVLEAVWMKAVALLTGSLVAVFFAARLLCVVLTLFGLYFNYRTALNIGIPPWIGVALIAAVGFFPLTTLVSSYVQPDNLAYALLSASLFFATQLRVSRRPLATTAALGVALGLMAVTKYHFFVSAAIPITLYVVARLRLERVAPQVAFVRLAALLVPAVALLAVQFALVSASHARSAGAGASGGLFGEFFGVLHNGVAAALAYLAANAVKAFTDFFVAGPNAATYWGALGLWDAPLIVVNAHVEYALRVAIAMASIAVTAIILYRLARNCSRLATIAARGRSARAALLATSDPVLLCYVLFVALMFALYVVTQNVYGAAGRQWYPYVFAAFFCTAWYAPRTFRRSRRHGPVVVTALVLAYALVASGYATAAVLARYYGSDTASYVALVPAPSQLVPGRALGFLWPVQGMDFHPLYAHSFRSAFAPGSHLWAAGAAIFPQWQSAADDVAIVVDDRIPVRTIGGLYDFRIAEATRDMSYAHSGFFGAFHTAGLDEGVHVVRAYARLPHRDAYQAIAPDRLFFLMPAEGFSSAFMQRLATAPAARGSLDKLELCRQGAPVVRGALTAAAGDVVLAEGRVTDRAQNSVVWLLVDGKPYPAQYGADGVSFFGTIAAAELAAGVHSVTAYTAIAQTSRYRRVPGTLHFVVTPERPPLHLTWSAPPTPPECDAP